jgi:hypothetical protein
MRFVTEHVLLIAQSWYALLRAQAWHYKNGRRLQNKQAHGVTGNENCEKIHASRVTCKVRILCHFECCFDRGTATCRGKACRNEEVVVRAGEFEVGCGWCCEMMPRT